MMHARSSHILFAFSAAAILALSACDGGKAEGGSDDKAAKADADGGGEAPAADSGGSEAAAGDGGAGGDAAPAEAAVAIDEEVQKDLQAIVDNCEINTDGATVKCENDERKNLLDKFSKGDKDRAASLDTLAVFLGDADAKKQTVAGSVMMSGMRTLGKDKPTVSPDTAKRLIEALGKAPKYQAAQAAPTVALAASATGDQATLDLLYSTVDAHEHKAVATLAYANLIWYGGTTALPKLQELTAGDDEGKAAAALEAFRNAYDVPEDVKKEVCPWVEKYIADDRGRVRQMAGWGAIKCGGASIDKLLEAGEKREAEGQFTRDDYMVFRDICFSFMGEDSPGSEEQCKRNYAFLEKVVKNEKVESADRGLALFAIYYQRRDDATMKLAKKYKGHKDPEVKKRAEEIIESLDKK